MSGCVAASGAPRPPRSTEPGDGAPRSRTSAPAAEEDKPPQPPVRGRYAPVPSARHERSEATSPLPVRPTRSDGRARPSVDRANAPSVEHTPQPSAKALDARFAGAESLGKATMPGNPATEYRKGRPHRALVATGTDRKPQDIEAFRDSLELLRDEVQTRLETNLWRRDKLHGRCIGNDHAVHQTTDHRLPGIGGKQRR